MRRLGRLAVAEWLASPAGRGPPWGPGPAMRRFLSDGALPGAAQSSTVDTLSAPADRLKEEHVYVPRNLKRFGRLLFQDGADRNRLRTRRPPSAAPAATATEETRTDGPAAPDGDESKGPPAESQAAAEASRVRRLFVSGLNPNTTWHVLKDHMQSAGKVVYTRVWATDGRGEGIVLYRTAQEAARALETLDNSNVEGNFIRLQRDGAPRAGHPKTTSSTTTLVDPSNTKGQPAAVAAPADEGGLGDPTDAPAPTPPKAPGRRQRPPRPPKGPAASSPSPATPPSESASDTTAAPAGKAIATAGEQAAPTDDPPASSSTHAAGSPGSSTPLEDAGPGPSVQALIFTMLHAAKTHIENYELVEADKQLELAAAAGATQNPAYLHLLSILRLKQRRIVEAAAARDTLLQQHPDMLDNPVILSNAAWLYVHQREPGKAIDLLERAEAFGSDAPKDTVYIRALLHSGQNQLDRAEEVLRRAVLPDGKLIPLQDTTDVKLGMLLTEVLVLLDRAKEAEPLVAPIVAASAAINGPGHVVTLCAVEGQAAVARALGRHAEAVDLLRPVVADLGRRLGPHDLTLSAVGLLAKAYLDLFLALRVQCGPVKEAPLSKAALDALEALRSHVQQWLTMAEQVDPQSHDFAQAKHHHEVVQLVCRLEGLQEADGAPPLSNPPATAE